MAEHINRYLYGNYYAVRDKKPGEIWKVFQLSKRPSKEYFEYVGPFKQEAWAESSATEMNKKIAGEVGEEAR